MKGKSTDEPIPAQVIKVEVKSEVEVQPKVELSDLVFEVNPRQYQRILIRRKEREIIEKRYAENNPVRLSHYLTTTTKTVSTTRQTIPNRKRINMNRGTSTP